MIIYLLIVCLVVMLILRFLYLGKNQANFKMATTNFGNKSQEPLILEKEDECLVVVTDPVGAKRTGESTCIIAKQSITKYYETSHAHISPNDFLKKACFLAHRGINEQMNANSGGCSITLVYIKNKQLSYASVGDIGIYLCDEELTQLNPFDLYKYQLSSQVLERKISEESLLNNRFKNELTAYLGHENLKKVNVNVAPIHLAKSDQILIVTKDVYEIIPPIPMERVMLEKGKPEHKIEVLKKMYNEQKQANRAKASTASAVLMSHFK